MRRTVKWIATREVHAATGILSWRCTKHPGGSTYYVRTISEPDGALFEVRTAAKGQYIGAGVLEKIMPSLRAAIQCARSK